MNFHFSNFNHCPMGKIAIQDIVAILGHQLLALGHGVHWPNGSGDFTVDENTVNVVLESFAEPGYLDALVNAHARGARFLCVATEQPTPLGFNYGTAYGMVERQNVFPAAARCFDGILHLVAGDEVTSWYASLAPAAHVELGYAPSLENISHGLRSELKYDFGFYGQMTHRRRRILDQLEEVGSVLVEDRLELQREERDELMRQARVIVTIRASDDVSYVSSTRCVTALAIGRPVVGEPHASAGIWGRIVHLSKSQNDFYDDAWSVANVWRTEWNAQRDRLMNLLPPRACLGQALEKIDLERRGT
jgi:hypothetical protein